MTDQLAFDLTAKVASNYKREGTSQRAAAYAARYANGAFGKIRTALLYGPATPDEIAERTGITLLTHGIDLFNAQCVFTTKLDTLTHCKIDTLRLPVFA